MPDSSLRDRWPDSWSIFSEQLSGVIDNWHTSGAVVWKLYVNSTIYDDWPIICFFICNIAISTWDLSTEKMSKARTNPSNPLSSIKNIFLSVFCDAFNCLFNSFLKMFFLSGHKHQIKHGKNDSGKNWRKTRNWCDTRKRTKHGHGTSKVFGMEWQVPWRLRRPFSRNNHLQPAINFARIISLIGTIVRKGKR